MKPFGPSPEPAWQGFQGISKIRAGMESSRPSPSDQAATLNSEPSFTLRAKGNLSQIKPQNVATPHPPRAAATGTGRGGGVRDKRRQAKGRAATSAASCLGLPLAPKLDLGAHRGARLHRVRRGCSAGNPPRAMELRPQWRAQMEFGHEQGAPTPRPNPSQSDLIQVNPS